MTLENAFPTFSPFQSLYFFLDCPVRFRTKVWIRGMMKTVKEIYKKKVKRLPRNQVRPIVLPLTLSAGLSPFFKYFLLLHAISYYLASFAACKPGKQIYNNTLSRIRYRKVRHPLTFLRFESFTRNWNKLRPVPYLLFIFYFRKLKSIRILKEMAC